MVEINSLRCFSLRVLVSRGNLFTFFGLPDEVVVGGIGNLKIEMLEN